jgi:hypothetical protein
VESRERMSRTGSAEVALVLKVGVGLKAGVALMLQGAVGPTELSPGIPRVSGKECHRPCSHRRPAPSGSSQVGSRVSYGRSFEC